ncbi:hypothetical protein KCM76_09060 [Zooshikella marina]|uniref:hypothetical protein n=1 Tax=Zooshikella ganghwensis TaxID=202772 RepID=UPI001BB03A36|nr:hypothetical protein [Zooshikella ganghwensis]MBU2706133.1 hypothetical protein [Zooshikella ganghwensis]
MLKRILLTLSVNLLTVVTANASSTADDNAVDKTCQGNWKLFCSTLSTCNYTSSNQKGYVWDNCIVNFGQNLSIGCSSPGYRAVTIGRAGIDLYVEWYFGDTELGRCPTTAIFHRPGQKPMVYSVRIEAQQ